MTNEPTEEDIEKIIPPELREEISPEMEKNLMDEISSMLTAIPQDSFLGAVNHVLQHTHQQYEEDTISEEFHDGVQGGCLLLMYLLGVASKEEIKQHTGLEVGGGLNPDE